MAKFVCILMHTNTIIVWFRKEQYRVAKQKLYCYAQNNKDFQNRTYFEYPRTANIWVQISARNKISLTWQVWGSLWRLFGRPCRIGLWSFYRCLWMHQKCPRKTPWCPTLWCGLTASSNWTSRPECREQSELFCPWTPSGQQPCQAAWIWRRPGSCCRRDSCPCLLRTTNGLCCSGGTWLVSGAWVDPMNTESEDKV